MKISLASIILDILQGGAEASASLFETMMRDRVSAARMASRKLRGFGQKETERWADIIAEKRKYYTVLYRLKKDGLIVKEKKRGQTYWKITSRGSKKSELRDSKFKIVNAPSEKTPLPTIISYDIPEESRRERDWLREILTLLDFSPLHKSVWAGNRKLPQKLIEVLNNKSLLRYVHIFEVTKEGTLAQIIFPHS